MTTKVLKFSIIIFSLLITACGPDCSLIDPAPPIAAIRLIDSEGSLLVGPNARYHQDSLLLSNTPDTIELYFNRYTDSSTFYFYYSQMINYEEYYLRLEESDIDTIILVSHHQHEKCADILKLDTLWYNSTIIKNNDDLIVVVK